MKIVALHNLGCKVNAYEMELMEKNLLENDFRIVPFDQKADIYIINTCSVTNIADRKSRQMLHRARSLNPDAVIIAAGCYVNTRGIENVLEDDVDIAVLNEDKKNISAVINSYLEAHQLSPAPFISDGYVPAPASSAVPSPVCSPADHTRFFIKVQDGCNQFCSYCIIPYARGRIRSRMISDVHKEALQHASNGFREIVLTGIHLSSYGLDRPDDNEDLLSLIKDIAGIEGISRIRLGSLEPRIITEQYASALAQIDKLCPQFHLSLQSGSAEVLRRMNRHYSPEEYSASVSLLRKYFHNPAITTDIIVGFPGETEDEFSETVQFVRDVRFYETHIFKYSRRLGTAADRMSSQLTDAVKSARSDVLLNINSENKAAYADSFINSRHVQVLFEDIEEIDGISYITGYTKEYVRAALPPEAAHPGQILDGFITGRISEDIMAFSTTL